MLVTDHKAYQCGVEIQNMKKSSWGICVFFMSWVIVVVLKTYRSGLGFGSTERVNHAGHFQQLSLVFCLSAELLLCVLVFGRMRGYPVIWLMLTGAYHAALSMREPAHHGNERSLMYHSSSRVSTWAPQLAKVSVCKTNRLSAEERGSEQESCASNKSHGFTYSWIDSEQRVSKREGGQDLLSFPHMLIRAAGDVFISNPVILLLKHC